MSLSQGLEVNLVGWVIGSAFDPSLAEPNFAA